MCNLTYFFYLINLICVFIFIIVWLNKKIILINKFNKYNRINILSCVIKYLDLHLSFNFFNFIFCYRLCFYLFINTHNFFFVWLHACIIFYFFSFRILKGKLFFNMFLIFLITIHLLNFINVFYLYNYLIYIIFLKKFNICYFFLSKLTIYD
jgi:hypothetical protein